MNKKQTKGLGFLILLSSLFIISCTDLEIEETDSIFTPATDGGFSGVSNVDASITQLYSDLYSQLEDQGNFFALNEVSTDEQLVPTRGTDWGDNGIWRTLHAHTWTPAHQYVLGVWNNLNQNVFRATEIIDSRSNPTPAQEAQAKFLRAFSTFWVLDLYGQVPFREVDEGPEINPVVLSRAEAYDFAVQDLTEALPNLPSVGPGATITVGDEEILAVGRGTKAGANFLLAKLYLNAHIYKGTESPDSADLNAAISAIDAISAEGFGLQSGYFDLFKEDSDNETIFFTRSSVGNRIWNGLHYHQNAPDNTGGGWNGFTTLAEFYDLFEGNPSSNFAGDGQEERRGFVPDATNAGPDNLGIGYGFLIGQQYEEDGTPLQDRPGNPLVFTKEHPGLVGNNERHGIRVIKYHPVNGSFTPHEIVFRYSDAHLMKAEAMFRTGGDPTTLVNELRTLRGATPLGNVTESDLLAERGRELYVEFWRRNDLIRFDQFTRDWEFKDPEAIDNVDKNLYPIPSNALLSNPNLIQNPGY